MTISNAQAGDAGAYTVEAGNSCGRVTSSAATLTVNVLTALNTQPANQTVCVGSAATFSVAATGTSLSYQWRKDGVNIVGATGNSYTIAAVAAAEAASYDVVVSGACGTAISSAASLTIQALTAIATPPTNQTVCTGAAATFSVAATGTNLTHQWRKDGVNISGATGSSYTIAAATAVDAANYDVVVSGACGSLTSTVATLTVNPATALSAQPNSLTRLPGQSATFSVTASGANLTYQWRKNGSNLSGATASSHTIASVTAADAGNYDVVVSGACGNVTSDIAVLTVSGGCGTPVVSLTAPDSGAIYSVGTAVSFAGAFSDTSGQTHTANWNFTSNLVNANQAGTVNETAGTVSASRSFTQAGVYLVKLTVTNNCGNAGAANTIGTDQLSALVVIYDPSAGFVTGGGWINSPPGAYVVEPTLTGKANFGFVSKYKNGATVPDGNTEFQFKAANLNFKSTAYEWLVIAGARAQFKGSGTINQAGDYRFILTAIDGQTSGGGGQDKFRIRIWNNAGGGLVYDNQLNAPDSADPTTVLGGGNIIIHRNGGGNAPSLARRAVNDFDGDGQTDVAVFRRGSGEWFIKPSRTGAALVQRWGLGSDTPVAADYDGDGKTDLAVWRGSEGNWYLLLSATQTPLVRAWGAGYAPYHDVPAPGDYTGDGRTELTVWRPWEQTWYILNLVNGATAARAHGQAGAKPVTAAARQ